MILLKMIHIYIDNQGLKQNLRRNEGRRRKISNLPQECTATAARGRYTRNFLPKTSNSCFKLTKKHPQVHHKERLGKIGANLRIKREKKNFFETYLLRTATPAEREGKPKRNSVQEASNHVQMMILQGFYVVLMLGRTRVCKDQRRKEREPKEGERGRRGERKRGADLIWCVKLGF